MDPSTSNESRAALPIAVVVVTLTIATIAVVLRTYTRLVLIKQIGIDDAAAIISLLLAVGCGTAVAANTAYGLGRHIRDVNPANLPHYFRTFYVSIVMYNATLMSIKFTFLLPYYRVFRVKKVQKIVVGVGVLIGCWALSQLLIVIFNCSPVNKFWDDTVPGTCIPNLPFWYINAAGNVVTDVSIFVLPLPVLKSLNLQRPQKILLMGIFSLGLFTCAISIIRIQYLHLSDDATWDNVGSACWPLVSKLLPNLMWSSHKKTSKNHKNGSSGHGTSNTYRNSDDTEAGLHQKNASVDRPSMSRPAVLHVEDLELQRIDDDTDLASLDGPGSASYGMTPRSSHQGLRPARTKGAEVLRLEPSAKTEIKASTPEPGPPFSRVSVPDHGIAVQRDVVIDEVY